MRTPNCSECSQYQIIQGESVPCRRLDTPIRMLIQTSCFAENAEEYESIPVEIRGMFEEETA